MLKIFLNPIELEYLNFLKSHWLEGLEILMNHIELKAWNFSKSHWFGRLKISKINFVILKTPWNWKGKQISNTKKWQKRSLLI